MSDVETWRRRGEAARLAHEAVNEAFRAHVRERDPDRYAALLQDFRTKTAAALPSSDASFMPGLANGHARCVVPEARKGVVPEARKGVVPEARKRSIETAIAFLEADPWFFRSGYEKQKIIQHLKRSPLTEPQRLRLAHVVLMAIDGLAGGERRKTGDRVEFRHYGRLACGVWSDFLDEEVAARMRSRDAGVRRRATWVAEAAISAGKA